MLDRQFSAIRIDVPLSGGFKRCFFVTASDERWDPWWKTLYSFLCSLFRADLEWKREPVQNVMLARVVLTEEQKARLLYVLKTAPAAEIAAHKTLRATINNISGQHGSVAVVFFRDVPS